MDACCGKGSGTVTSGRKTEGKEASLIHRPASGNYLLVGLTLLLLLFSLSQSFQIAELKSTLKSSGISVTSSPSSSGASPSAVVSRPASLPAMVGGC